VIVRIFSEGQYRLDESHHHELDELDDAVVARVDAGDEGGFRAAFDKLLTFVREHGTALSDDELEASDFILPPADLSFAEAGEEFSGEGLIPDPPAARA
jgi:PspAA-like protein